MKVRMNVSIAGHSMPEYSLGPFSFVPGEVVDLDERLATIWLKSGHALPFEETAALETPETTTLPRVGKRSRGGEPRTE